MQVQMGHNDLGEFYYQLGDLPLALKSFAQARDYCTTDKHVIEMCLNVSKVRAKSEGSISCVYIIWISGVYIMGGSGADRPVHLGWVFAMFPSGRTPHAQLCARDQLPHEARSHHGHTIRPNVRLHPPKRSRIVPSSR